MQMRKLNKWLAAIAVIAAFVVFGFSTTLTVNAAKGDQGIDISWPQGTNGKFGYGSDKFAIIGAGGHNANGNYTQATYKTQVASSTAAGLRTGSYFWDEDVYTQAGVDQLWNYIKPTLQTPKGSIVAIDFEAGAQNKSLDTDLLIRMGQHIKDSGYTPVLYSGAYYMQEHVDYQRWIANFGASLWVADYHSNDVQAVANPEWYPIMDGMAMIQFTSNYRAGGLDGNIDLTGITDSGYKADSKTGSKVTVNPNSTTAAIKAGQIANNATKASIKAGYRVKVNLSAQKWATGQSILSSIKGQAYTVAEAPSGSSRILLSGVNSWINRQDVEILQTASQSSQSRVYVVKSGDSWWSIANAYGTDMYSLAALNGKSIQSVIHPGDSLKVIGAGSGHTYYRVLSGDSFWAIGQKFGINMYSLAANNHLSINSVIYPDQSLYIK